MNRLSKDDRKELRMVVRRGSTLEEYVHSLLDELDEMERERDEARESSAHHLANYQSLYDEREALVRERDEARAEIRKREVERKDIADHIMHCRHLACEQGQLATPLHVALCDIHLNCEGEYVPFGARWDHDGDGVISSNAELEDYASGIHAWEGEEE